MPKQNRQPGIHLHRTQRRTGSIKSDKVSKEVYQTEYYWILISKNGRTIARSSETYKRKGSAIKSIEIVASYFENNQHYHDHTSGTDDLVVYSLEKSK